MDYWREMELDEVCARIEIHCAAAACVFVFVVHVSHAGRGPDNSGSRLHKDHGCFGNSETGPGINQC